MIAMYLSASPDCVSQSGSKTYRFCSAAMIGKWSDEAQTMERDS